VFARRAKVSYAMLVVVLQASSLCWEQTMSFFTRLKSATGFVLGRRTLKKQVTYIKSDISRFKRDMPMSHLKKSSKATVDQWETFIKKHKITTKQLKHQYGNRRIVASLLLILLIIVLYVMVVSEQYSVGLVCFLILSLLYLRNSFRLYQIRHRKLCTTQHFLKQVRSIFKECLPLKLPENWCGLDASREMKE